VSAQNCGCGYPLLAPVSKGRGTCEKCHLAAGGEHSSYTVADAERRQAEKNSNSGGRA
jgi:hypothetical protein